MTVTCRRSAVSCGVAAGVVGFGGAFSIRLARRSRAVICGGGRAIPRASRSPGPSVRAGHRLQSHLRGTSPRTAPDQGLGATPRRQWSRPCWSWFMIVQAGGSCPSWPALPLAIPPVRFCGQPLLSWQGLRFVQPGERIGGSGYRPAAQSARVELFQFRRSHFRLLALQWRGTAKGPMCEHGELRLLIDFLARMPALTHPRPPVLFARHKRSATSQYPYVGIRLNSFPLERS